MLIVADTHVHVYRDYDVAAALRHGIQNLSELARRCGEDSDLENALLVLFLAEAEGCHFFEDLCQGSLKDQLPGWSVQAVGDDCTAWVGAPEPMALEPAAAEFVAADASVPAAARFLLVAGRQIVTKERLEVLALATPAGFPRDLGLEDAAAAVRTAGGVPVLSWAPGKWSSRRGERVASMIEESSPEELLIGDSSLRARATEPDLMRRARERGLKVIAGSDPLPIDGEERLLGSYGSAWLGEVEVDRPRDSLRSMLLDPEVSAAVVGDRSGLLEVVSRLGRHALGKKLGGKKPGGRKPDGSEARRSDD